MPGILPQHWAERRPVHAPWPLAQEPFGPKDGISLVQTAEGALTEVHDMLNRMVELATQSANGTYASSPARLIL